MPASILNICILKNSLPQPSSSYSLLHPRGSGWKVDIICTLLHEAPRMHFLRLPRCPSVSVKPAQTPDTFPSQAGLCTHRSVSQLLPRVSAWLLYHIFPISIRRCLLRKAISLSLKRSHLFHVVRSPGLIYFLMLALSEHSTYIASLLSPQAEYKLPRHVIFLVCFIHYWISSY